MTMAKHMDSIMRGQIQFWIESHKSVAWIARSLGKPPSTIWREILNHRIQSDKGYGCSNRLCAKFGVCTRPSYGATDYKALAKNSPGCFEACPDFREAVCERLSRAPFVCNGCEQERSCPLMKRFYLADGAEAAYRSALVNSRSGVHPDDETAAKMGAAVRDGLSKGQSVRHILRANAGLFGDYADSTVYGWINDGLFAVVLPDNGPEFSDPEMIEKYRPDPVHNSTKLASRGVKVFFCDPYCSSQKPHVERVHIELRRIFEKGAPFDSLRQEHVNLAMSHINSLTRDSLGGATAYDAFVEEFGARGRMFLDALGIKRIPASQVTLHPFLLGEKFQRIADKAVLRKNGVKKPGTDELKK